MSKSFSVPSVVFRCPVSHILLDDCPYDLVMYVCTCGSDSEARLLCSKLDNKYSWTNPSGHKAQIYKLCTLAQWEEWEAKYAQLSFGL